MSRQCRWIVHFLIMYLLPRKRSPGGEYVDLVEKHPDGRVHRPEFNQVRGIVATSVIVEYDRVKLSLQKIFLLDLLFIVFFSSPTFYCMINWSSKVSTGNIWLGWELSPTLHLMGQRRYHCRLLFGEVLRNVELVKTKLNQCGHLLGRSWKRMSSSLIG